MAVLLSGTGRTLMNIVDQQRAGKLNSRIELVIASRPNLVGAQRAVAVGLATTVLDRRDFASVEEHSREIFARCDQAGVQLVVLAGWLTLLSLPQRYENRVMNIHPALLPGFGGKGMYGHHVHQAVLDYGCKISGCTVHFVDNSFDHGPIIVQQTCPVLDDDTVETLAARVFEQELIAYPQAISLFEKGKLKVEGRKVRIAGP